MKTASETKKEYSAPVIEEIALIVANQILELSGVEAGGRGQVGSDDSDPID